MNRSVAGETRTLRLRLVLIAGALLGVLASTSTAMAADPPTISFNNTPVAGNIGAIGALPTFTIDGSLGAIIDWNFTGTATNSGTGSSATPTNNGDGLYTLHAMQTPLDPFDPPSGEATVAFTLDATADPPATITSSVPGPTATSANFTWIGEGPTYSWQLTGPTTFSGSGTAVSTGPLSLVTGSYTFSVTATTLLGHTSTDSQAFTIDTTPPTGTFTLSHAPAVNAMEGFIRSPSISLKLAATSSDATGYALTQADSQPALTAFSSQVFPRNVSVAPTPAVGTVITVYLWARDAVGNRSTAPLSQVQVVFDNAGPHVAAFNATTTSFPAPGANLETNFGTNAIARVAFDEPIQRANAVLRMCLDPCGVALPGQMGIAGSGLTGTEGVLDPSVTLATGTRYEIEVVTAFDRAGNPLSGVGATSPWIFTTSLDGTPPGPITSLVAAAGIGQVALSWTRPSDPDLGRITVLRATSPVASAGDPASLRFSLGATATSFTDVGLTPGVTYHYAVYAEDAVGNPSALARASAVPAGPRVLLTKPKPPKTINARFMRPKQGKVIGTLRPLLRWRPVRGAVLYNIQIVNLTTGRKVVSTFPRVARYRVTKGRLKAGQRFVWRVWAYRGRTQGYVKLPMTSWFDVSGKAKK